MCGLKGVFEWFLNAPKITRGGSVFGATLCFLDFGVVGESILESWPREGRREPNFTRVHKKRGGGYVFGVLFFSWVCL